MVLIRSTKTTRVYNGRGTCRQSIRSNSSILRQFSTTWATMNAPHWNACRIYFRSVSVKVVILSSRARQAVCPIIEKVKNVDKTREVLAGLLLFSSDLSFLEVFFEFEPGSG